MNRRTVLLVNPDAGERERLCRYLSADPSCRVVAVDDCDAALSLCRTGGTDPDVILVEPDAVAAEPDREALADLRGRCDGARILAFAGNGSEPLHGVDVLPRPESLLGMRTLVANVRPRPAAAGDAGPRTGFDGFLEGIPLGDLLQILCVTQRTGACRLHTDDAHGTVWVVDGEIRHADDSAGTGPEALFRMLRWGRGRFGFDPDAQPRRTTIQAGWEHLLMEGMRRFDEAGIPDPVPAPAKRKISIAAAEEACEDLSGRCVGPYQLVRRGEHWGDADLYEALNPGAHEHLHLIVLDSRKARDPLRVRRFVDRGQRLSRIDHRNLVRTVAVGESSGVAYCAEEHVDGTALAERIIDRRPIDAGQALEVFRAGLRAILRLEVDGLYHGAIDASAVILGRDGVPRLARLNGLRGDRGSAPEDASAFATALRGALRADDLSGPVDRFLASVEAAPPDDLEPLLAFDPESTGPRSSARKSSRRRTPLRRLAWATLALGLTAAAAAVWLLLTQ